MESMQQPWWTDIPRPGLCWLSEEVVMVKHACIIVKFAPVLNAPCFVHRACTNSGPLWILWSLSSQVRNLWMMSFVMTNLSKRMNIWYPSYRRALSTCQPRRFGSTQDFAKRRFDPPHICVVSDASDNQVQSKERFRNKRNYTVNNWFCLTIHPTRVRAKSNTGTCTIEILARLVKISLQHTESNLWSGRKEKSLVSL